MPHPVAGRMVFSGLRVEVIGAHHLDGARREETHAVELAAVRSISAEPQVIVAVEKRPPPPEGPRGMTVGSGRDSSRPYRSPPAIGVNQGEPGELLLRYEKRGVLHPDRIEDARAQELGERLPESLATR